MKYHFIGIGGIGMSGLALHLAAEGHVICGSNFEENERVEYLRGKNIQIMIGHSPHNISSPDIVVRTTAISGNNPELVAAVKNGIPVLYRMELLKRVLSEKQSICVTGTDGKTTTTAMLSKIFIDAGKDPTVFLGGKVPFLEHENYRRGSSIAITELDESDGFFASFKVNHALFTNVRFDHLEHYGNNHEHFLDHLILFSKGVSGKIVYNRDDDMLRMLFEGKESVSFGKYDSDYRFERLSIKGLRQTFEVFEAENSLGVFELNLPGEYNIYNALGAIAMARQFDISPEIIRNSLASFVSADRRFTVRGYNEEKDLYLIDDYAHTPDEIRNTIKGAREAFPDRKLAIVFQPHRYSRLARENGRFAASLKGADEVCVFKLYDAYEKGSSALSETEVLDGLRKHNVPSHHYVDYHQVLEWVEEQKKAVILFLGAGDITELSRLSAFKVNSAR
ncbi:UDP-N-acetylmuramate--alanine ligase [Kosmotoga arenicorallina S304]|uniref:UDP-N-acetylmuramate--L-alanine ligase n=1 Tax=Kosmotoga arenicorallina S304 TaxID=1453497 RepID=A0A182C7D2_9BACT|nr:UDP-N-acetylmuramate--L-alanine ligase [Kosmotoga arenicorallina]OAA31414.1 UDP-N-acetylmuramate--alanine ligase [Kosmotoga arenicorallina S304]